MALGARRAAILLITVVSVVLVLIGSWPLALAHPGETTRVTGVGGLPDAKVPASTPLGPDDWPMYLHDPFHSATNPNDTAISIANVSTLALDWSHQLTNVPPIASAIVTSPTVVGNTVYIGAWDGNFSALNATSGEVIWHDYLGQTNSTNTVCKHAPRGITSAAAVVHGVVYVSGGGNYTYALNATTGAQIWSYKVGNIDNGNYNWGSPMIYGGYEYLGVSSDCDSPLVRGALLQLNLTTGHLVNEFFTVPSGDVGGTIWTTPVFDPAQNEIIISTGNCNGNNYAESPYCGGLIALNLNDISQGSCTTTCDAALVPGHWQDTGCGPTTPDCDLPVSPTLFTTTSGVQMVSTADKNGTVWAFRAGSIDAGPVWRHTGLAAGGNIETGRGLAATAVFTGKYLVDAGQKISFGGTTYNGSIFALYPDNGSLAWRTGLPYHQTTWGALSYQGGLVLEGTGSLINYNGTVFLLNATDGTIVWHYPTPGLFYGPVSVADGHIFAGDYSGAVYSFGAKTALAIPSFLASPATIPLGQSTTLETSAVGGAPPYAYLYTGLPPGCASANTPSLVCTPSVAGVFDVSVRVTDSVGASVSAQASLTVESVYSVTFSEIGLPSGTNWSVTLQGTTVASQSTSIGFTEVNGSYGFSVGTVFGYSAQPPSGTVNVQGAPISESINFTRSLVAIFNVTFVESGLPTGTNWSVTLNGSTVPTSSAEVVFLETNGTYGFSVGSVAGYFPAPAAGVVTVRGSDVGVNVTFTSTTVYVLSVVESGLPTGTNWSVSVNGSTVFATGTILSTPLPNGTYTVQVNPVAGYVVNRSSFPAAIAGASVSYFVSFSAALFSVDFLESGLSNGTYWFVSLNGSIRSSSGSGVDFEVPNGTYSFSIGAVHGYSSSPSSGTVQVAGKNVTEQVHFTTSSSTTPFSLTPLEAGGIVLAVVLVAIAAILASVMSRRRRQRRRTRVPAGPPPPPASPP